jgi:hypothetical protein
MTIVTSLCSALTASVRARPFPMGVVCTGSVMCIVCCVVCAMYCAVLCVVCCVVVKKLR